LRPTDGIDPPHRFEEVHQAAGRELSKTSLSFVWRLRFENSEDISLDVQPAAVRFFLRCLLVCCHVAIVACLPQQSIPICEDIPTNPVVRSPGGI
jgi:hypothetical protein